MRVYYFAYEETIQEDALRLVAAKVAAALRVNGDTIGDDGLADLDEMAAGDLVATLAKIVTGEVAIEARSLQQAFAEANASLRQANTLIGEYHMVEEEPDEKERVVTGGNGRMHGDVQRLLLASDRLDMTNVRNDRSTRQPSLFTNGHGQAKPNGAAAASSHLNGTQQEYDEIDEVDKPVALNEPAPPPVPRPRLFVLVG